MAKSGTILKSGRLKNATKVELVYEKIKGAILNGELQPGQLISANDFSRRLGVARNAVRESIARLRAEGLVRNEGAYSRTYVEDADLPATIERYELRECVEGIAARLAAHNMNAYQVKQLRRLAEETTNMFASGDIDKAGEANLAFHRYIMVNCGNNLMLKIYDTLSLAPASLHLKQASKTFIGQVSGVPVKIYLKKICDAVASRNGEEAEACIRERIRIIAEQMREYLEDPQGQNEQ